MIRLIGVMLIFTACCTAGMNLSLGMKRKLERLRLYRRMTDEISTLIRYRSLTIREIMAQLKANAAYSSLNFLHDADYDDKSRPVGEIWLSAVTDDFTLSSEEKKLLPQLGIQLGTTDTEGQLSVIGIFNEELEEMIKNQTEKYAIKGKLFRSIGILAGAMLGILII